MMLVGVVALIYIEMSALEQPILGRQYAADIQPTVVSNSAAATPAQPTPPYYTVSRVVDGDTVVLDMHGVPTTLRLIGIDTPEVVDPKKPVQCYGPEASTRAHQLLDNQVVKVEEDQTQGEFDKYHRTLAYIFLPDGTNFEEYMIENGFGREYTYKKPYKYQKQFKAAQAKAKAASLGLWSACPS